MHFDYSDTQREFKDTIRRWLRDNYDSATRRHASAAEQGWSTAIWTGLADLGVTALTLPEDFGGLGGGAVERMLVAEELGRANVVEPWIATVALAGATIARAGTEAQKACLLPEVAEGKLTLAIALAEPGAVNEFSTAATRAETVGGSLRLTGRKSLILNGDTADMLLVSARDEGDTETLYLLDPAAQGVTRHGMKTQDGRRMAALTLEQAPAERLGDAATLCALRADALATLCAEAVGLAEAGLEKTLEYLRVRHQFRVPLASFQVLQHRAAEVLCDIEQMRSMAILCAMAADHAPADRAKASSQAKLLISQALRRIGQALVHMHGGIGITMENDIGHYFKRMEIIAQSFGSADYHSRLLAA